ncbi:MAG: hypothetical protein MI674_01680 [Cytophagales bacterium]|nr:hypothetical protein [Cytophagales bacterium]
MKKNTHYIFHRLLILFITVISGNAVACQRVNSIPSEGSNGCKEVHITVSYKGAVHSSLEGYSLIKEEGEVDENLLAFLKLFGIKHDGTVASINQTMQENFLRRSGLERRDLGGDKPAQEVMEEALNLLRKMGFVDEIPPLAVQADYFLLFGAFTGRMEERFEDFVSQYEQGTLQCNNIVLLGGFRKLREDELAKIESEQASFEEFLKKVGKERKEDLTEADAIRFIWDNKATERLKENFKEQVNLFFINDTDTTQGTNQRPTTKSTIETWYDEFKPAPGPCHANVEMPYGIRMEKVLRTFLENASKEAGDNAPSFSITWNSPAATPHLSLAIYKDELARAFYQETKLRAAIESSSPATSLP